MRTENASQADLKGEKPLGEGARHLVMIYGLDWEKLDFDGKQLRIQLFASRKAIVLQSHSTQTLDGTRTFSS